MARQVFISNEEIQRAKQLRDQATSITDYRKALSVILVAEFGLTADRIADMLGTSRRTVFRDRGNIRNQYDTAKSSWGGRRTGHADDLVLCRNGRRRRHGGCFLRNGSAVLRFRRGARYSSGAHSGHSLDYRISQRMAEPPERAERKS